MDYRFQVNLKGIIALLSNNLYSGPRVFLRELLQNAVDAIHARQLFGEFNDGRIDIEVINDGSTPPTIVFQDNGIGLSEEEVHRFLATIGESSKRDDLGAARGDFIGQFGIGLLSCFMVADEIVMITKSAQPNSAAVEWRGRPDGTYSVRPIDSTMAPGTRVYLRCKEGSEEFYDFDRVCELAALFGGILPYPIHVTSGRLKRQANDQPPPWRRSFASPEEQRDELLQYGRDVFETEFFDAIPLRSEVGGVDGVAFVLPFSPSPSAKAKHRVYLKNMLLSESAEDVLPPWAFFVRCIINAQDLRPTASRESFYPDKTLSMTRQTLGKSLRQYMVDLARNDRQRLERLIAIHFLAIKALAVHDADFYRMFIDWMPFETSMGRMTMGDYRKRNEDVYFVPTVDQFRQITHVAASQRLCVINAGYTYDQDLIMRLPEVFNAIRVEEVTAQSLARTFEDLSDEEQTDCADLLRVAEDTLGPLHCACEIRKFKPRDLATLYNTSRDGMTRRVVQRTEEVSDENWAGMLGNVFGDSPSAYARLFLNYENALIRKLAGIKDDQLLGRLVQMLYVQSLLMGHHPLSAAETQILNTGLMDLINLAMKAGNHS